MFIENQPLRLSDPFVREGHMHAPAAGMRLLLCDRAPRMPGHARADQRGQARGLMRGSGIMLDHSSPFLGFIFFGSSQMSSLVT